MVIYLFIIALVYIEQRKYAGIIITRSLITDKHGLTPNFVIYNHGFLIMM